MRLHSLAACLALASVGCVGPAGEDTSGSAGATSDTVQPLTVVHGREWARCWFEAPDQSTSAMLICRSTARGSDPLGASVQVVAAGLGSAAGAFQSAAKTLDIEAGGTVVVGTFTADAFPVLIDMHAMLTNDAKSAIGETDHVVQIGRTVQIAKADDLPSTDATVLKQPFDLWPLGFIDRTENHTGFVVSAHTYSVPLAPYKGTFDTDVSLQLAPNVSESDAGKIRWFIAPASGAITLDVHASGVGASFDLQQPGYYSVTGNGLRVATNDEAAAAFGGHASTGGGDTPDASTTPDPTPTDAGAPTPPTDPTPTCGGDGQDRCPDGSCDPNARFDSNETEKCVACGAAGQTYCFVDPKGVNQYSGFRCNAGTRYDSNQDKCVACGNDGQTYCYADANNSNQYSGMRCNAGTRYDSNQDKCVACGNDGQTYCYADPNNTNQYSGQRCNAGTRYDSNQDKCVACGNVGQTYCYTDPNNTNQYSGQRCNAGLHIENDVCVQ